MMTKLMLLPFRRVTLPGVGLGIFTALVAQKFARPFIVETLRLGYEAKDATTHMLADARRMASEVSAEAKAGEAKKKA